MVTCDALQGERGYNGAKPGRSEASPMVIGRKRHIAVDADGRLLAVRVTAANIRDQDGGIVLVRRLVRLCL